MTLGKYRNKKNKKGLEDQIIVHESFDSVFKFRL